jgi:hypothetical protein
MFSARAILISCLGISILAGAAFGANPQKDFAQASYDVKGGNQVNSRITNLKVVLVQDDNAKSISWSLSFDVHNLTQDTGDGNTSLYVDVTDSTNAALPGGRIAVNNWRNHCYYDAEGHKSYSGKLKVDYDDFISRAHGISLSDSRPAARVGKCY